MISFTLSNNKTFLYINDLDRVFFVVCKVLTTNIADMRCIGSMLIAFALCLQMVERVGWGATRSGTPLPSFPTSISVRQGSWQFSYPNLSARVFKTQENQHLVYSKQR